MMKRRSSARRTGFRERRKVFFIATEGSETEPRYFEAYNAPELKKNVHVHLLNRGEGTDPQSVVRRMAKQLRNLGAEAGDEFWVVVDKDTWQDQALMDAVATCTKYGFCVAISNPCFELWLLLHNPGAPKLPLTPALCVAALERALQGYSKADYAVEKLIPHVQHAIRHAQRLDAKSNALIPAAPGTRVYRLAERLIM